VRFWAVLVMLGVFVWFLNFSGMDPSDSGFGEEVMSVLLIPAFVLSLFIGVIATADCVSSEKREGTLGLLFLTDLKGYDVICGKLAANSVNAIYGLVAILPVLGLPVMLGGVTFAQFVKLAVALFSTMIFSLSVGIFVSTYSRNDRKAMFFTVLILLAVTVLPILLTEMYLEANSIPEHDLWTTFLFSPGYGIIQTMDGPLNSGLFPEFSYWLSMLWQWLVAAALIARASDHIPHSWEESAAKKNPRLSRLKLASRVRARSAKGRAWLKRNPFLWLAMQDEEASPRNVWLFVLAVLAIWLIATLRLGWGDMADQGLVIVMSYVLHIPLLIWIAAEASRHFSADRSNNTFETLLSTPLSARQIIQGQWLALLRQFAFPIVAVLVWEGVMQISARSWQQEQVPPFWPRSLLLVPDAIALAWAGMWFGLKFKGRIRAILGSLLLVLFVPWLMTQMAATVIEPLGTINGINRGIGYNPTEWEKMQPILVLALGLLTDFLVVLWATSRLPQTFRQLAVRR
jgi:ABC-type Na+ efflux pump permease subunit